MLQPISPYASTSAASSLDTSYSELFGIRFIACGSLLYGPRQRPDLAIHKFARMILRNQPWISVFGDGDSRRDYTYVDDIVFGHTPGDRQYAPVDSKSSTSGNQTVSLLDMIRAMQLALEPGGRAAMVTTASPATCRRRGPTWTKPRRCWATSPTTTYLDGVRRFAGWLSLRSPARHLNEHAEHFTALGRATCSRLGATCRRSMRRSNSGGASWSRTFGESYGVARGMGAASRRRNCCAWMTNEEVQRSDLGLRQLRGGTRDRTPLEALQAYRARSSSERIIRAASKLTKLVRHRAPAARDVLARSLLGKYEQSEQAESRAGRLRTSGHRIANTVAVGFVQERASASSVSSRRQFESCQRRCSGPRAAADPSDHWHHGSASRDS